MSSRRDTLCVVGCALLALATPAWANPAVPLKIALVRGNAAQAVLDKASGAYRGVAIDVARAIARRAGRVATFVQLAPAEILLQVESGAIDLGFVATNPDRMGLASYSQPYLLVEQTAFVRAQSGIVSVHDLDRAGHVVGANTGDSITVFLARNLTRATVRESPDMTMQEAVAWVREGKVTGFAGNRQRLGAAIAMQSDLRLLPDALHNVSQVVAVAHSRPDLLALINRTIAEMKRSGALGRSVKRSGVSGISAAASR